MAKPENSGHPPATLATTATNDEPDRAEIETRLDRVVPGIVAWASKEKPIAGWHLITESQFATIEIGNSEMPFVPKERAERLVALSATNPHAFDLASYIAGTNVIVLKALGIDMCPPLSTFAARVLTGEVPRPPQPLGRPRAEMFLRLWQYGLCRFVATATPLHLTRNDEPGRGQAVEIFTACDAVAQAFTRAGPLTTYGKMKSLCYDAAHREIRELAEYLGITEGLE